MEPVQPPGAHPIRMDPRQSYLVNKGTPARCRRRRRRCSTAAALSCIQWKAQYTFHVSLVDISPLSIPMPIQSCAVSTLHLIFIPYLSGTCLCESDDYLFYPSIHTFTMFLMFFFLHELHSHPQEPIKALHFHNQCVVRL